MNVTDGFREAIEAVYAAFADIPCPTHLAASPYRDAAAILTELTAVPLRDLSEQTIGKYAGWAMTTVGDERDFMHFLPRIIELAAYEGGHVGFDPKVLAARLIMAGWTGWGAAKQEAVKRCFREAFLLRLLSFGAADWLCGIAHLGLLSDELLEVWLITPGGPAIDELADFIEHDLGKETITEAFWKDVSPAAQRRIVRWARSDAVRSRLWAALERAPSESRAKIEGALAVICQPGTG